MSEQAEKIVNALKDKNVSALEESVKGLDLSKIEPETTFFNTFYENSRQPQEDDDAIGEVLARHGADIEKPDNNDYPPLFYAIYHNHLKTAEAMLERKVKTDFKIAFVDYPIFFSASSIEMHKLLVKYGVGKITDVDPKGNTLLHIHANEIHYNKDLLNYYASKIDINAKNQEGDTPLTKFLTTQLISGNSEPVTKLLLDAGADVNARGDRGFNALQAALWSSKTPTKVVQMILDAGVKTDNIDDTGSTALHNAAAGNSVILKTLLEVEGANPNIQDTANGSTPLMVAAKYNNKHSVDHLLAKDAKVNITDHTGRTALNYSLDRDYGDVIEMLQEKGAKASPQKDIEQSEKKLSDKKEAEKKKITSLKKAIRAKDMARVEEFFNKKTWTPEKLQNILNFSASYGDVKTMEFIISKGADVNKKDENGYLPVIYAVHKDNMETTKWLVETQKQDLNDIEEGARNVYSISTNASPKMMQYILKMGAKQETDENLFEEAVWSFNPKMVRFLEEELGLYNRGDYVRNEELIRKVIENDELDTFKLLHDHGLNLHMKIDFRMHKYELAHLSFLLRAKKIALYLIENNAPLRKIDENPDAPFSDLINWEDMDVIEAFYSKDERDVPRDETTGQAFKQNALELAFELQRPQVVKFLLDQNIPIDNKASFGMSALHLAADKGYLEITKKLLKMGANTEDKNSRDMTPLEVAEQKQHKSIIKLLKVK